MFFIFHGPEEFLRAEAIKELRAKMGEPSMAAMNTTVMDGRKLALAELINVASALPFLGDVRLVVIEGLLGRLEGKANQGASKAERQFIEGLSAYLPSLSPSTWLVFDEDRILSEAHPILRAAKDGQRTATVKLFGRMSEVELRRWLAERAKLKGGTLSGDAIEALVSFGEPDLRLLDQEIEKLITYAGKRPVNAADVKKLVHGSRHVDVFAMVDALGQRSGRKAIEQFHALVEEGEPPGRLLFMITRQFRMILQAKELSDQRASLSEVMRALSAPKFVVEKMMAQARTFSMPQLEMIYRRLLETDQSIKTGQAEPLLAVDVLIAEIAARGGAAERAR